MIKFKKYSLLTAIGLLVAATLCYIIFKLACTEVVIEAKVLDPNTSVRASNNQTLVSPDQGWQAIKVEVQSVTKGHVSKRIIWLENMFRRSGKSGMDWKSWQCERNKIYYFTLTRNKKLSTWCQDEVYSIKNMNQNK
jgi:hypothetical protein